MYHSRVRGVELQNPLFCYYLFYETMIIDHTSINYWIHQSLSDNDDKLISPFHLPPTLLCFPIPTMTIQKTRESQLWRSSIHTPKSVQDPIQRLLHNHNSIISTSILLQHQALPTIDCLVLPACNNTIYRMLILKLQNHIQCNCARIDQSRRHSR